MSIINRVILLNFIIILSLLSSFDAKGFTIIIDPGHGGKDKGAIGRISSEKNINLAVSLELGKLINENLPDIKVVYTRKTDTYKKLHERPQIANEAKGDLFISIHCNSVAKKNKRRNTINGATTYVLGLHRSSENLDVAMRENSVIELESDYSTTYKGFDPNSSESYIIFEIAQEQHLASSIKFAQLVQEELSTVASRKDLGVKQAGFLVLAETSMTSVLIELDFLCNPKVEKYLASEKGQKQMAKSIYNAIQSYIDILSIKESSVNQSENADVNDKNKDK